MPRAYSTDLRERALTAYEGGEGSQSEVAERYRVGERTLSAWLRAAREEGRRAPRPRRGGRPPLGGRRWPPWSRGGATPPWPRTPPCWPSARACAAAPPPRAGPRRRPAFAGEVPIPALRARPDALVVMDDLAAHKAEKVRGALDRAGLAHRYLPSCSPDMNPIEPAWSKLETRPRAVGARSREAPATALG